MATKIEITESWKDQDIFIIGGGPSINSIENINELLKDKNVIGVNDAYQFECTDLCLFGDTNWYKKYKDRDDFKNFKGVMVSCSADAKQFKEESINYVRRQTNGLSLDPAKLAFNGHTGAAAINMAILMGASRIFLLGFDMTISEQGETNWHPNISKVNARRYKNFIHTTTNMAKVIAEKCPDVEIFNCNPNSALECFTKIEMEDAFSKNMFDVIELEKAPKDLVEFEESGTINLTVDEIVEMVKDLPPDYEDEDKAPETEDQRPVVMTVLNSGGDFILDHVIALKKQLDKHITIDYNFICLTDFNVAHEDNHEYGSINFLPLTQEFEGWHAKLELFQWQFDGPVTYFDLDTIITGNIDHIINHSIVFGGLGDFNRLDRFASGVMQWTTPIDYLGPDFSGRCKKVIGKRQWHQVWDQRLIEKELRTLDIKWIRLQDEYFQEICSYKLDIKRCANEEVPESCKILCFHGHPRPWRVEQFKYLYE